MGKQNLPLFLLMTITELLNVVQKYHTASEHNYEVRRALCKQEMQSDDHREVEGGASYLMEETWVLGGRGGSFGCG